MCGRWLVAMSRTKERVISSLRMRRCSQRRKMTNCTTTGMIVVSHVSLGTMLAPKISMGASNEPAVVILLYELLSMWYIGCAQACFGECSQWGYWARVRNVEGCFAAPGVRVSHSPHRLSTYSSKVNYFVLDS